MDSAVDEQPPDPTRKASGHTVGQKAVLVLNVVVVIACLAGAGGLLYGKRQLDNRLQTDKFVVNTTAPIIPVSASTLPGDPPVSTSGGTFPPADPEAKNFLITGSDANACVDPNSPWKGAADPARENIGMRSDTIMVMRVDPTTRRAAVLSFPRDLWVQIPGRSMNRINTAYVKNDYSLLAKTLYTNFGIVIDHYIQVDFCAFKRIVDAVGGVAVPFSTPIQDVRVGINILQTGCHTFHGDEALAYVRSRHLKWLDKAGVAHEDRASDLGRISRQQDFLRRVLQAALEKGLFDPAVAQALIKSLQTDVVTESHFSLSDMLKFAGVMHDIHPAAITQYQIETRSRNVRGNAVLDSRTDTPNMKAILRMFQGKAPLAGAPEQVFDTSVSSTVPSATGGASTTVAGDTATTNAPVTTTKGSTSTTGPQENPRGDILPDRNVVC